MPPHIRLATRKSALAQKQCALVADALEQRGISTDTVLLSTTGDDITDRPLADIGGKGLFITALQNALADGRADVAVHSLKDMEAKASGNFTLAAVGFAEDPRDVLLGADDLSALAPSTKIGTCSPRRAALLAKYAPQAQVVPMRGNLNTRLAKLEGGECDVLILAAAGLHRLGQRDLIRQYLPPEQFIPAVGQGLLALECLSERTDVIDALATLGDNNAMRRALAERAFAAAMHANCSTPLGAHASIADDGRISMRAFYQTDDGQFLQAQVESDTPQAAGEKAAAQFIG